jgi:hypothetical protein
MRSKRASTVPTADRTSEFEDILALSDSSPLRPITRKRHREDNNIENDTNDATIDQPDSSIKEGTPLTMSSSPATLPDANLVAFAKRHATSKQLKPDDILDMEAFAANSVGVRQIKMMVDMRKVLRMVEDKQSAKAPFVVSKRLNVSFSISNFKTHCTSVVPDQSSTPE